MRIAAVASQVLGAVCTNAGALELTYAVAQSSTSLKHSLIQPENAPGKLHDRPSLPVSRHVLPIRMTPPPAM
jgi:hypothetical protein